MTTRTIAPLLLAALLALLPARAPRAAAAPGAEPRTISGRLLGHDGKPMRQAEVHCGVQTAVADPAGRYRITVPAGLAQLQFSGVDHATATVPILDRGAVALDVALGTDERPAPLTRVELTVMQRDAKGTLATRRKLGMTAQPDGTFVADVEAEGDQLLYELAFNGAQHSVNGTQATRFWFDGNDYASQVAITGGRATVRFDPRLLPPPSQPLRTAFGHASHAQLEIVRLKRELDEQTVAAMRKRNAAAATAVAAQDLERKRAGERDPVVRAALLVQFLAAPEPPDLDAPALQAVGAQLTADIPADSDLWELWPMGLTRVARSQDPALRAYAERAASELGDHRAASRVVLALGQAAERDHRADDARRFHRELTTRYRDLPEVNVLAAQLDPARKIRVGQPVPAIDLPALDEPGVRITREALRGKVVLFELWATWCKPCVEKMAGLHEAYKTFADRGLVIVSINVNESPEVVAEFRKLWPMPWRHVVGEASAAQKVFESNVLPTYLLVDASGTIVATSESLRGPQLQKTLERVLPAR